MDKLNGKNLYFMFLAGANRIIDQQSEINRINVFPVADADTGTNMASTIRTVVDSLEINGSFKITADSIGMAALAGARGNSGIIFAQFLYGFSEEICECTEITSKEFAESLKRAVKYLYEAVANPVEGTILTVIREWIEFIHEHSQRFDDFANLMVESYEVAKKSLLETTNKLAELTRSNVVDAGAKGFVVFLEGMKDMVTRKNIKQLVAMANEVKVPLTLEEVPSEEPEFRYCTEAMIDGADMDKDLLKKLLAGFGDSVVVAGSSRKVRLHVHTNKPADLFVELRYFGTISFQKVEDMQRQFESAHKRKYSIALVTDSTCDLPVDFIEKYQIHVVPINMNIDGNNYLDGLTITHKEYYKLAESAKEVPSTSQPSPSTFVNLYSQLASRYDSVIAIHISGGLSGTFNTSLNAASRVKKELNARIDVLDGKMISGAVGLQVMRIAEMIDKGLSHDEILTEAEKIRSGAAIYVSVRTLKYFIRSGRVSPLKGLIAQALKVKPIVSVAEDGKAVLLDKSLSYNGNRKKVINRARKAIEGRDLYAYSINHVMSPGEAEYFIKEMTELTGRPPAFVSTVSPSLGTHTGKGTVAVTLLVN